MSNAIHDKIIRYTARAFLKRGWAITVFNGGDGPEIVKSKRLTDILEHATASDEATFIVTKNDAAGPDDANANRRGFVSFVLGNGWESLHDYSVNLDREMDPITAWIERHAS